MINVFILGVMGGAVLAYFANMVNLHVSDILGKKKALEKSIKSLDKRVLIHNELIALRKTINADRVSIISYNIGDESASMNYETCRVGVPPIIQSFQSVKTTMMLPMLLTLERRGFVAVDKTSDNETKLMHENIGIVSSYKYKIGNTIEEGCLVVAYNYEHEVDVKDADIIFQTLKKLKGIYGVRN